MGYHGIHLLCVHCQILWYYQDFSVAGAGLLVFIWPLRGVLIGVFLEYFSLWSILTEAMHQSCFVTSRKISRMACMNFLVISSAALLGVVWKCDFSSLKFTVMIGTVGFFPGGGFRRCSYFIYFLQNLYAFKYFTCLLVGPTLKLPAL